jgi:hypothetical protein
VWIDDVSLLPYPCALGDAPRCSPPKEEETCVDWADERRPRIIGSTFTDNGFSFAAMGNETLRIVLWGPPPGEGKLAIPRSGLRVQLPFEADRVVAHVWASTKQPVRVAGFSATNAPLTAASSSGIPDAPAPEAVELRTTGIASVVIIGGGGEGDLVDLCVFKDDGRDRPTDEEPKEPDTERDNPFGMTTHRV